MSCGQEKFWLENPKVLASSTNLIPRQNVSLEEQLNSLTRLVFVTWILLALLNVKNNLYFLAFSLAIIIFVYYIQRRTMQRLENYSGPSPKVSIQNKIPYSSIVKNKVEYQNGKKYLVTDVPLSESQGMPYCDDAINIDNYLGNKTTLINQHLSAGDYAGLYRPNPKTLIAPAVCAPSHELTYWRDNNLIVHSSINAPPSQEDMYLSGYAESTCCGYLPEGSNGKIRENFRLPVVGAYEKRNSPIVSPIPTEAKTFVPYIPVKQRENFRLPIVGTYEKCNDPIVSPIPTEAKPFVPYIPVRENFQHTGQNGPGMINTTCGYNPDQLNVNLPSNLPAGECEQNPVFSQYNKNLFTQIVTPGVYTRNEIIEPISSNIGISFQQQFEPLTCSLDENEDLNYVEHDPRVFQPQPEPKIITDQATLDNVYDPRFYGYGTSYRSYIDSVTGQPRFMYDDVNAIKQPNYVVRSNIDFLPYADTYGPAVEGNENGNSHTAYMRPLVQDSWLRNSLQFRNELSERRMRKINAEKWEQRQTPLWQGQS